jgi:hypothetical protein
MEKKSIFRIFKRDRRRRYKKPLLLVLIAVCFIFAPLINTLYNAIVLNIPIILVIQGYDISALILMGTCLISGIGLLFLKLWSWYLFLFQALIIISFNVYNIYERANYYNIFILCQSLVLFVFAGYFLRRDVFAPFFTIEARGFRRAKREKAEITVEVDGLSFTAKNISAAGLCVTWPNCPKKPGDEVTISFLLDSEPVSVPGGITRIRNYEVSLAFRKRRILKK